MAIAHLVAIAGCYQPDVRDCMVQCAAPTDCTGGQICRDGWCAMADAPACASVGDDGGNTMGMPDGRPTTGDAPDLCAQGCKDGICSDGVCVIDCSATNACQHDIKCPPNLPCRVVCGDSACKKKVSCDKASTCEVQCTGAGSCQDDILCNANRCVVHCSGMNSCKQVKCKTACACDVSCTGMGSCTSSAECPDPAACQLGEGCSSLLAGCDRC